MRRIELEAICKKHLDLDGLSVVLKSNDCFLHWVLVQGMDYSKLWGLAEEVRRLGWVLMVLWAVFLLFERMPCPGVIPFSLLVPFHLMACTGAKNQSNCTLQLACVLFCGGVFKKPTQPESIQHTNAIIQRIWTESLILSAEFHQKSLLQNSAVPLSAISHQSDITDIIHTNHQGVSARDTPFLEAPPTSQNIVLGAQALIGSDGHHVRHAGWPATQLRATCELITLNQEAIIHLDTLDASEVVFRLQWQSYNNLSMVSKEKKQK